MPHPRETLRASLASLVLAALIGSSSAMADDQPAVGPDQAAAGTVATQEGVAGGTAQRALQRLYAIPHPEPGVLAPLEETVTEGGTRIIVINPRSARPPNAATAPSARRGDAVRRHVFAEGDDGHVTDEDGVHRREGHQPFEEYGPFPPGGMIMSPYFGPTFPLGGARLPHNTRRWTQYRYFGGTPGRHGYGNQPFGFGASDVHGDVYRFGFLRGYDRGPFEREGDERSERLLVQSDTYLDRGLVLFREGKYQQAADAFRLSADANHGDPASRLYAAHTLFALGRYQEAATFLRRAFELQPKIAYLHFDLRDDYGRKVEFDHQLAALESAVERSPNNLDRLILLGYVYYYSNRRADAYAALTRANQIDGRIEFVSRLMENSRPPDIELEDAPSR